MSERQLFATNETKQPDYTQKFIQELRCRILKLRKEEPNSIMIKVFQETIEAIQMGGAFAQGFRNMAGWLWKKSGLKNTPLDLQAESAFCHEQLERVASAYGVQSPYINVHYRAIYTPETIEIHSGLRKKIIAEYTHGDKLGVLPFTLELFDQVLESLEGLSAETPVLLRAEIGKITQTQSNISPRATVLRAINKLKKEGNLSPNGHKILLNSTREINIYPTAVVIPLVTDEMGKIIGIFISPNLKQVGKGAFKLGVPGGVIEKFKSVVPGGVIEKWENLLETAIRELYEETGILVTKEQLEDLNGATPWVIFGMANYVMKAFSIIIQKLNIPETIYPSNKLETAAAIAPLNILPVLEALGFIMPNQYRPIMVAAGIDLDSIPYIKASSDWHEVIDSIQDTEIRQSLKMYLSEAVKNLESDIEHAEKLVEKIEELKTQENLKEIKKVRNQLKEIYLYLDTKQL